MYSALLALAILNGSAHPSVRVPTAVAEFPDDRAPNENMDFRLNAVDGESLNAERFDAWLASKGIRIAGGPPADAPDAESAGIAASAATEPEETPAAAAPIVASRTNNAPATRPVTPAQPSAAPPVVKRDQ